MSLAEVAQLERGSAGILTKDHVTLKAERRVNQSRSVRAKGRRWEGWVTDTSLEPGGRHRCWRFPREAVLLQSSNSSS